MDRDDFVARAAADTHLTERQAEAYWYRHVVGQSRRETAEEMGTSASNVDNLERSASRKVRQARTLLELLDASERGVADSE
jgi:transcriptional regulator